MGASHSSSSLVQGTVAPGYETVREMFRKNIETGRDREAQLCVYVEGEVVVDLWGSAEGDTTYTADSLQCIFSSSKAVTAIAVAQIAERGLLQYQLPVASYWPEFAQDCKGEILVEDILRHEGGMPHLDTSISLEDLLPSNLSNGRAAEVLARQSPIMPVNTPREYHNLTAGWIINEVSRRVSPGGVSLGSWIRKELASPLQADVYLGLEDKELEHVRNLTGFSKNMVLLQSLIPNAFGGQVDHNIFVSYKILKSFAKRFQTTDSSRNYAPDCNEMTSSLSEDPSEAIGTFMNLSLWRKAECPHGNMHASARGLARLAAAMANGGRLGQVEVLSPRGWALLHGAPIVREDASMKGCRTEFTQGGVNVFTDYEDDKMGERVLKSGRAGFVGWLGLGGSVMQWHPTLRLGFGYTCTLLTWWDMANIKGRKLQKEAARCAAALKEDKAKAKAALIAPDNNNNVQDDNNNIISANANINVEGTPATAA